MGPENSGPFVAYFDGQPVELAQKPIQFTVAHETFFKNATHPDRGDFEKIIKEATQVAAVAVTIIESTQRQFSAGE